MNESPRIRAGIAFDSGPSSFNLRFPNQKQTNEPVQSIMKKFIILLTFTASMLLFAGCQKEGGAPAPASGPAAASAAEEDAAAAEEEAAEEEDAAAGEEMAE